MACVGPHSGRLCSDYGFASQNCIEPFVAVGIYYINKVEESPKYVCTCVYIYIIYICMYVCMYVCMHVGAFRVDALVDVSACRHAPTVCTHEEAVETTMAYIFLACIGCTD